MAQDLIGMGDNMDFLSYWDKRIEANKRLFDNNPGIANFLFDECQLLYEHMTKDNNEHMRDELQELRSQLAKSEQRVKALEKYEQQMKTLQALCGHIEDGSSDSVTLSQDDATGTWHITVGYSPRKRKSFWGESFDEVFLKAKFYVESTE